MQALNRSRRLNSEGVRCILKNRIWLAAAFSGLCILLQLSVSLPLYALEVPALTGRVNDYASMISQSAEREIDDRLARLEEIESTQIVVLTIDSLEGEPLEEYSIRVAEAWGIGQKSIDNGALLLVAKKERKARIEVGYGLEGSLTDLVAGRIVDNDIVPLFQQNRFDEGFVRGVDLMIAAVQGEYVAEEKAAGEESEGSLLPVIIILILIIYFYSQVPRGGGGHGSGPLIFTGAPGERGWYGGSRGGFGGGGFGGGGFSGGGGGFGGGGSSGSW